MSTARSLRGVALTAPHTVHSALPPPPALAVWLAVLAVALQLTMSSNFLTMVGIAYNTDGGNPIVKFHPATYLAVAALLLRLMALGRPLHALQQLAIRFPSVALFMAMMSACMVWVVANIGVSGAAVFVESYISAGILFLVLVDATIRQRRLLGWMMLLLLVANGALATGETVIHRTLLPMYLAHGKIYEDVAYEFRGLALYDHALTGGMMTEIGILLLIAIRPSPKVALALALPLMIGLISFGGRSSLLVCAATVLSIGGYFMLRRMLDRTLRPVVILGAIIGVVAVIGLFVYLLTETSIGVRLAGKLSFSDDSTASRSVQWLMPGLMSWRELMFGISSDREIEYIYQLGLQYVFQVVENFWLVAFINLGIIGFSFYLTGFLAFLAGLWRRAPLFGRAILVTTIIVASTSNSLGRKSNVLFVTVAAVIATTGFARTQSARARPGQATSGAKVAVGLGGPFNPPPYGATGGRAFGAAAFDTPSSTGAAMALRPATFEVPARAESTADAQGGMPRDPAPPERALRPLRLSTAPI